MDGTNIEVAWPDSFRRVEQVDLEPVVFKLMHPDPGEQALSLAEADEAVVLYRCFLKLCLWFPAMPIVPTRVIDRVWHVHLLDTAKYQADCQLLFGRFLDHFPYAGLRGEEDKAAWLSDFERTRTLFREHFGVEISEPAQSACHSHDGGSDCCVGCVTSSAHVARPRPDRCATGHLAAADAGQ